MHHFLESAGRAGSRPTCRRPIRPQRRGAPRRRNKGWRGAEHHAQLAGGPSDPRDVVPCDEGTRVSGEQSTTSAQSEAPPLRRNPALTPGRRLIQFRLAPAHPAGGYLSRRQPRPLGRRPESPNQWRGHGVESLGGRRPQQTGTPTRLRPAEASSKPASAPPGGQPTYAPLPARLQQQSR